MKLFFAGDLITFTTDLMVLSPFLRQVTVWGSMSAKQTLHLQEKETTAWLPSAALLRTQLCHIQSLPVIPSSQCFAIVAVQTVSIPAVAPLS